MLDRPAIHLVPAPSPDQGGTFPRVDLRSRWRRWVDLVWRGIVVVPQVQSRVFDFALQHYAFEVFHRSPLNRWSHFVGIPVFVAAAYALTFGVAGWWLPALVCAFHLATCMAHRMWGLIPLVVLAHAGLVGLAMQWAAAYSDGPWWAHPVSHLALWPTVQYLTHALEPQIPAPWSLQGPWTPMAEFFRRSSWKRLALIALAAPAHAGVEAVSSPKNLLVEIFGLARGLGMPIESYAGTERAVAQEANRERPAIDHGRLRRRLEARDAA